MDFYELKKLIRFWCTILEGIDDAFLQDPVGYIRSRVFQLSKGLPKDIRQAIYHEVVIYLLDTGLDPTPERLSYITRYTRRKHFNQLKRSRRTTPVDFFDSEFDECPGMSFDPTTQIENRIDAQKEVDALRNLVIDNFTPHRAEQALLIMEGLSLGWTYPQISKIVHLHPRRIKAYVQEIRELAQ